MDDGAVTAGYGKDQAQAHAVLNSALATELVCVLRYKRHSFMAAGIFAEPIAQEFAQHAAEEQAHADQIARRIVQLGGAPDFSPEGLSSRSHADYVEGNDLKEMIQENLVAERIAIEPSGRWRAGSALTIRPQNASWRVFLPRRRSTPTSCRTSCRRTSSERRGVCHRSSPARNWQVHIDDWN